ncbi:hypothetical protein [Natronoglycomyces albus]|uniref:Uncharacterized protein n=1 Tax=Natronoglycomyces albus TaxID=2811108 RepID=A0A895XLN5_9ACTN|nr:hypothetical protein [Natronoglycomyces albus]QSB04329.1 hypothetical protein JQS30_11035 [Natronoglycomyces albus]
MEIPAVRFAGEKFRRGWRYRLRIGFPRDDEDDPVVLRGVHFGVAVPDILL